MGRGVLGGLGVAVAGLVVGAAAVLAIDGTGERLWNGLHYGGRQINTQNELARLSTPELARRMLGDASAAFVADTRGADPRIRQDVTFFDLPRPWGRGMCRVNAVWVQPDAVAAKAGTHDYWKDPITVQQHYFVLPDFERARGLSNADQTKACAGERRFDHLIIAMSTDDANAVERAVELMSAAKTAVAKGKRLEVVCEIHLAGEIVKACDGERELAAINLRDIRQVNAESESQGLPTVHQYLIWLDHPLLPGEHFYERSWMIRIHSRAVDGNLRDQIVKIEMTLDYAA